MKTFLKDIKDVFFPPKCISCYSVTDSEDKALCPECERIFRAERTLRCSKCGRPSAYCVCKVHYNGFTFPVLHVTGYDISRGSVSKNIVLRLKDEPLDSGFELTSRLLCEVLLQRLGEFTDKRPEELIYTWVPRSEKSIRKAGHDQSKITAEKVAKLTGGKLSELIYSTSASAQKSLSKEKRQTNAESSYILLPHENLRNKTVVLIDDIVTSGASMGVCGTLIRKAGAENVIALVFAKTEREETKGKNKREDLQIY